MSDTTFVDYSTAIVAEWLNEVNDHVHNDTPITPATAVHDAALISNTPAGNIESTTVQAAINELDTSVGLLAPIASPTFTGVPAAPTATAGTNTTQLATTAFVTAAATSVSFPTGAVITVAMETPPTGFLECDGSAVSRTTYSALFTAISTVFGVGDGSTTFNLPDLRGEFVRGWDHGRGVDSGRAIGSSQADELKAHTHGYDASTGLWGVTGGANYITDPGLSAASTTGSTGGPETRPRNIALMYVIKT